MQRRLILLRHAKSSWKTNAPSDHARPLGKRGRRDAPRVGAALRELGWTPDHVLSSDAERTRETFERMAKELGFTAAAQFRADLYHAGVDELRYAIASVDDEHRTLLVLGHNPGWEQALEWLSGADDELKTGCAALLSVEAETWRAAMRRGAFTLETVIRPRELHAQERS